MPTPGDVDLVVAAELMEGGRAIQRGLVTPDRSVLITSSHRSYAVSEKSAPGNGIADPNKVLEAGRAAAKRFMCFDLQDLADRAGSVISASLFGAVAGSGALPFSRDDFEATVRRAGLGVDASLRAFALGRRRRPGARPARAHRPVASRAGRAGTGRQRAHPAAAGHDPARLPRLCPAHADGRRAPSARVPGPGLCPRISGAHEVALRDLDARHGGEARQWELTCAAARYLATAMAYDDVIRVADLKTRATRFERVRQEVGARPDQLVYTTEFMHPRLEEICGTLPAGLGRWLKTQGLRRLRRAPLGKAAACAAARWAAS